MLGNLPPMALSLCAACARHVRVDDQVCPFCGTLREAKADPTTTSGNQRAPRFPRSSRAALVFGALAISASAAACSKETVAQVYGAPPPPPGTLGDAGTDGATSSPLLYRERDGATSIVAPYGAPPEPQHPDAGAKKVHP